MYINIYTYIYMYIYIHILSACMTAACTIIEQIYGTYGKKTTSIESNFINYDEI
jgi:hypothetical protein